MARTSIRPIGFDPASKALVDAGASPTRRWSPREQREWYDTAWRRIRRRGVTALAVAVAAPIAIAATLVYVDGGVFLWMFAGLAWAIFLNRYAFAPCPRCHQPFGFRHGSLWVPRQRRCLHCGLGRGYRPADPTPDERDD